MLSRPELRLEVLAISSLVTDKVILNLHRPLRLSSISEIDWLGKTNSNGDPAYEI
jgi:hypothetical protein